MNKLNLYGPLNTVSYGYVVAYIFKELLKLGVDIRYFPIGQIGLEPQFSELIPIIQKEWEFFKAPCLKVWHQFDLAHYIGSGPTIAFPIFELNKFSDREKMHMENADYLFVCSSWAKSICDKELNRDPNTTIVVPLGVNTEIFKPGYMLPGKTIFGNFGKWEIRKGHDILANAFNKAFEKEDDVELWLMPHNHMLKPNQEEAWKNSYLKSKLGDKIQIMERKETQEQVYNIMKYIHCAIFPHRAEGWNLEGLEALACGKHVITTDYSGPTEYFNNNNARLIKPDGMEDAYDGLVFFNQGQWAKFESDYLENLIQNMRDVHKMNMEGNLKENSEGIKTAQQFTWSNTAVRIKEVLCSL